MGISGPHALQVQKIVVRFKNRRFVSPFPNRYFLLFDVRQDPTRRPNFLKGNYPRPPSPGCTGVVRYVFGICRRRACLGMPTDGGR